MPARRPEELHQLVCQAVNAGDIPAALALYEPNASFVVEPGKVVTGTEAIRETLSGFITTKPTITVDATAVESGDLALASGTWSLTATGPDGSAISDSGQSRVVARRQPNGDWLVVIDDPSGGG